MSKKTGRPDQAGKDNVKSANQRGAARLAAVQALYQMELGQLSLEDTIAQFSVHHAGREVDGDKYLPADGDFFGQILKGVLGAQLEIDPLIDQVLTDSWPVQRIDATLRAILRCSSYELLKRPDIPENVIISEYLDVTRAFFDDDAVGMVNAVLDSIKTRRAQ
jgi:N utilization substance protein B